MRRIHLQTQSASHLIYPDAAGLARAAAVHFVDLAAQAIEARGRFTVALSGGSTPRAAYSLLANAEFAPRVDWPHVHIFWGDERADKQHPVDKQHPADKQHPFVPPDHPGSNYRMARETLLDKISIPAHNVHRIRSELPPDQASAAYQAELEAVLGVGGRFDLILLGMGADGHTASLFPGTAALKERERLVVAVYVERLDAWRVTLTLPVINEARQVTFLVSGASKAAALARVRNGDPLPAGLVRPTEGELTWIVDQDALKAS